jgi:RNA polymerase sigma factor (sigma-70 family)
MSRSPQSRDAAWVRDLVGRLEKPLVRYAARFFRGDLDRARDVVQDAFLRLVREGRVETEGHEAEWLYRVCRNRCLDVLRKDQRMTALGDMQMATDVDGGTVASAAADTERRDEVAAMLEALPPRQQEVIRLKFLGGLSYKEIARVTNLTATNVGFLIHTGLKTVRRNLEQEASPAAARCGAAR